MEILIDQPLTEIKWHATILDKTYRDFFTF